jgi:hypothetical protein
MSTVSPDPALAEQCLAEIRFVQPDGAVLVAGTGIRFRIQVLKPGFVLLTGSGARASSADDALAELAMLKELDAELQRSGELTVFADLRETSRMAAHSRDVATDWMRDNRGKLKASHVLVRSKLLEMALAIVAMVVGGGILKLYSRPRAFLEVVREVEPNLLELPAVYKHALTGS